MAFTSSTSPLCRWCAKPIGKYTTTVHIHEKPTAYHRESSYSRYAYVGETFPRSKAECERLTNKKIISLKYSEHYKDGEPVREMRHVSSFHEWDGETYVAEFFCSNACAMRMGFAAVDKHGFTTKRYRDAIAARSTTTKGETP